MALYRLLMALASPLLVLWSLARVLTGRERWGDLRERLGLAQVPRAQGPTLWVHAASNGELASCEEVLRALLRADPALQLLITTNSTTGRALARDWALPRAHAVLAPFDWRWAATRLIARLDVVGLLIVESEFWPNRILAHHRKSRPVAVIGARLSRKSAKGWRQAIRVVRPLLKAITWIVPQDKGSRRRLHRMGVVPDRLAPVTDLKSLYSIAGKPGVDPAVAAAYPPARTWLAASTHPGEDETILSAHVRARDFWPHLELILAPRHPRRADEIRRIAQGFGLPVAQRSREEPPQAGAIYLADTLGEMPRFYANAEICFVAGSLVERGGHTPFEPAAFGCALLHGPYLRNFQAPYRRLDIAGGALQVRDAETLALALGELRDPARRQILVKHAKEALGSNAAPEPLARHLLELAGRSGNLTSNTGFSPDTPLA